MDLIIVNSQQQMNTDSREDVQYEIKHNRIVKTLFLRYLHWTKYTSWTKGFFIKSKVKYKNIAYLCLDYSPKTWDSIFV